jgi:hypothetical protein
MFRASLGPSSGEQDCLITHVVMAGCVGCGRVELGSKQCVLRGITLPQSAHRLRPSSTRPQPTQPAITTCVIEKSCSPDDGPNDARNMLRVN